MNKKVVSILVVALSLVSLSLAAWAPMNVDPAELDRFGVPGNGTDDQPYGDAECDEDGPIDGAGAMMWSYGGANGQSDGLNGEGVCDEDCLADGSEAMMWNYAGSNGQGNGNNGNAAGAGLALGELSDTEVEGLILAIEEEYKARALYEFMIDTFGSVAPFVEIATSEANHASVLVRQAEKYGVEVPAYDPSAFDFPTFSTIEEAYQAGVDAEIADADLYDQLMADVAHADLERVYTHLQTASLENHLVSFQEYLDN